LLHEQASTRGCLERLGEQVRNQATALRELEVQFREAATVLTNLRLHQRLAMRQVVETLERASALQLATDEWIQPLSAQVVAQVFLQEWLPPPPAQVLVWDAAEAEVHGLSALGYQVVTKGGSAALSDLGFPDDALDAVVILGRPITGQELFCDLRALRRGGRIVSKLALVDAERVDREPIGLRLLEVAYKVKTDQTWTYRRDISLKDAMRIQGATDGVALIAAEKN
jgi:hypothetical protein